jgi:hypothetical protein
VALLAAVAALLGVPACDDVPQLAPTGAVMTLIVNPLNVPASGGVSVITAVVTEAIGTPVPDGTVVQFFTDLGTIDREGRTSGGVARVNFISDARSGTASITAVSGLVTGAASVIIGEAVATNMIVIADPSRIVLSISRTTHIIATVLDGEGNPVPNIGCIFTVDTPTELMDSQGHPIFTDNNGRCEDVVRTRRTTAGTVTVNVRTLGGTEGSVSVPILLQ